MAVKRRKVKYASGVNAPFTLPNAGSTLKLLRQGYAMSLNADSKAAVRAQLASRIDMLGRELSHLSPSRIAFAVDDIRREARRAQMDALATLASGLERAMANSGGNAVVMPYLEAMGDALDCDSRSPAAQATLLASVGLRSHG